MYTSQLIIGRATVTDCVARYKRTVSCTLL